MSIRSGTDDAASSQGVVQADSPRTATQDVFDTIGQQVRNLDLRSNDGHISGEDSAEEPEEYRWGNEKVVEKIESLCMNCQQNVSII